MSNSSDLQSICLICVFGLENDICMLALTFKAVKKYLPSAKI